EPVHEHHVAVPAAAPVRMMPRLRHLSPSRRKSACTARKKAQCRQPELHTGYPAANMPYFCQIWEKILKFRLTTTGSHGASGRTMEVPRRTARGLPLTCLLF